METQNMPLSCMHVEALALEQKIEDIFIDGV